jgi:hypothetical protein
MAETTPTFLLVLGEREGIWWVLSEQRMAFEEHRVGQARQLNPGVGLMLYATRGAFHNPTRDRGQIIGSAIVTTSVAELDEPVLIGGRTFTVGCNLQIQQLARRGQGVVLAALVGELQAFPAKHAWSARMRQPLVPLPAADVGVLRPHLDSAAASPLEVADAVESYRWARAPERSPRAR